MILRLDQLQSREFEISGVNILFQQPVYRTLEVNRRRVNGFLYILHGKCRYRFRGGSFELEPGSVVYLPTDSVHRLETLEEGLTFYRIDFQIRVDGETVLFSDIPVKMCTDAPREFAEAVQRLADQYAFLHDTIGKTALLATMLHALTDHGTPPGKKRLSPAIRYLLEHLTEGVDCDAMAQAARLGTSQFYVLFRREFGMTPLQYRDSLLLSRATALLQDGLLTVTEIADSLGFESVAYFSRFFKKHMGVSPSQYAGN